MHNPDCPRNRFTRIDSFMYTLWSYASLMCVRSFFLFIEFAADFSHKRFDVEQQLHQWLGDRLTVLQFSRLLTPGNWASAMRQHFNASAPDYPVWLLQNDDHPFVDVDATVLCEALSTFEAERLRYKMIIPSHWPYSIGRFVHSENSVQRSTLLRVPLRLGSIPLDAYTIISRAHMRLLVDVYAYGKHLHPRFEGGAFRSQFNTYLSSRPGLQQERAVVYVPFRELARKFDGYCGRMAGVPQLILPPQLNKRPQNAEEVRMLMTCTSNTRCENGSTSYPRLWLTLAQDLFARRQMKSCKWKALQCTESAHSAYHTSGDRS